VPALELDNGTYVSESVDICRYFEVSRNLRSLAAVLSSER